MRCVDEIYPYDSAVNALHFPFDDFADEAARRVLLSVPLHSIPMVRSFADAMPTDNGEDSGSVVLPGDFLRLARFRMSGWRRPVLAPIADDSAGYALQFNRVTRGGVAKPVVVLSKGKTLLEYFSVPSGTHDIVEADYIPFTTLDDTYPENLLEITAWVLASLVLGVSNDSKGAQEAAGRANELITIL